MADGTLCTGFYPYKQWIRNEVVLKHDAICENRKQGGGGSTRKGSMIKRKAELCTQILHDALPILSGRTDGPKSQSFSPNGVSELNRI